MPAAVGSTSPGEGLRLTLMLKQTGGQDSAPASPLIKAGQTSLLWLILTLSELLLPPPTVYLILVAEPSNRPTAIIFSLALRNLSSKLKGSLMSHNDCHTRGLLITGPTIDKDLSSALTA